MRNEKFVATKKFMRAVFFLCCVTCSYIRSTHMSLVMHRYDMI